MRKLPLSKALVLLLLSSPFHLLVAGFSSISMTATGQMKMSSPSKHTLYDMPVSNNGARCRLILYKKNIPESEVTIVSPAELGGLKTDAYLALNPQGKMPLLTNNQEGGLNLPESDTICRYLMSTYSDTGPSFLPDDPKSNLIARLHDMYLTTIQGCMYKPSPPYGIYRTKQDALAEFEKQLSIIDDLIDPTHTYIGGKEVSYGDAALFPTIVFAKLMLPKFGKEDPLPKKLDGWFEGLKAKDADFAKVYDEVAGGIKTWEGNGRWDPIWLAGQRDEDPDTIFDKIIAGEIPATIVKDEPKLLAFKDINPAAPAHVLVIPKDRNGLSALTKSSPEHVEILGQLMVAAGEIAKDESLGFGDGARIVVNDGKDGGQEVPHIHLHVLGGRQMNWPPG